ncbi:hypothetical protein KJ632_00445 [Patescibacteria group bacterium]|nr:hypothetical protein [Patescibacteria group bacterium]
MIISISLAVALNTNFVAHYLASVMHVGEEAYEVKTAEILRNFNYNPDLFEVEFSQNAEKAYAHIGSSGQEVMKLTVRAFEDLTIDDLKLTVGGLDYKFVDNLYLSNGEGFDFYAKKFGNEFLFKNLNRKIANGEEDTYTFYADFAEIGRVGERFSLDVFEPGDFALAVDGDEFAISDRFPSVGEYFTIVR